MTAASTSPSPLPPSIDHPNPLFSILSAIGPLLGLVLVYGLFVVLGPPNFLTWSNASTIATQTAIVGIAALGMTLIIISGGIDLSAGSMIALTTVVIAWTLGL